MLYRQKRRLLFWGITTIIIAGSIAGMVWVVKSSSLTRPGQTVAALTKQDWIRGDPAVAKVTLIEYGDFQCPACGGYYPVLKQLETEFGSKLAVVFRHFPLTQHANEPPAARATEAAGAFGKFWEMHDMIYEHQQDWSDARDAETIFQNYAAALGIDRAAFIEETKKSEHQAKVDRDFQSGLDAGINSTPTFFLNGIKLSNPTSLNAFRDTIAEAIATTN